MPGFVFSVCVFQFDDFYNIILNLYIIQFENNIVYLNLTMPRSVFYTRTDSVIISGEWEEILCLHCLDLICRRNATFLLLISELNWM